MKHVRATLLFAAISLVMVPAATFATPSANFYEDQGEIFDDWDVCRTRAFGENGFFQAFSETEFRPIIVAESLGENADSAYQIGQQLAKEYPNLDQRAEKIFAFARDKIRYASDADQFGFKEFAQNADEVATTIEDERLAYGDCEDYAVFLAVMYKGAGLRSAVLLAPDHAAALVYLPGYEKANVSLSIDGESGWVWAEATGGNNPLGWMPERFMGEKLGAYEVEDEAITAAGLPGKYPTTITKSGGGTRIHIYPFVGVIAFLLLLPLFRR
jgi:transglutaminase-like putative cysteine protease